MKHDAMQMQSGKVRVANRIFFDAMLSETKRHRFHSHPFLSVTRSTPDFAFYLLRTFYKVVQPFRAMHLALGGTAPDEASLDPYLRMLATVGISEAMADEAPECRAIVRMNMHLWAVIEHRDSATGYALLAAAESAVAKMFPAIRAIAELPFPGLDTTFFDSPRPLDYGMADGTLLFANAADPTVYDGVRAEVRRDLDFRAELFDEWVVLARC